MCICLWVLQKKNNWFMGSSCRDKLNLYFCAVCVANLIMFQSINPYDTYMLVLFI